MASFQEHLSYLTKHGLSKTNRFQVIIPLPPKLLEIVDSSSQEKPNSTLAADIIKKVRSYFGSGSSEIARGLDIMTDSTELPGKNISTTETKYNGDFRKMPYNNVYENHQFVFKCSRDMYEKNIIDDWMKIVYDPVNHFVGYEDDYVTDITINVMDTQDRITHSVILVDAYPTVCAPLPLANSDVDNYATLQTVWAYRRWVKAEENVSSNNGLTNLSQTALGPYVTPLLNNPAVQSALEEVENTTGLDLEGEALNIYNTVDSIVQNTTGESINKSVTLLNGVKSQTSLSNNLNSAEKDKLGSKISTIIGKLKG